ncbi:hypothetical protein IFM89_033518 [Coptis chinensis]|uniref:Uncharacterized protein n=1 Tax=Coptis chinensis TaxID=261450 RepID=A0A835LGD5_9MAGN|nr:hypothetical protein IFM89_033518 [Coptis chinensis]
MSPTQKHQSQPTRKPLQPKNFNTTENVVKKKKLNDQEHWFEISLDGNVNKENNPVSPEVKKIEPFDSSLAEELNVIRKRIERLRVEKDKTEKLLREKDLLLEMEMKEIQKRGNVQNEVEMEIEKLKRLKELESYCRRTAPIKSLREREEEKKIKEAELLKKKLEEDQIVAGTSESAN